MLRKNYLADFLAVAFFAVAFFAVAFLAAGLATALADLAGRVVAFLTVGFLAGALTVSALVATSETLIVGVLISTVGANKLLINLIIISPNRLDSII
jgi:lipid-A-disaccharide synthase-like uncharacterized protein